MENCGISIKIYRLGRFFYTHKCTPISKIFYAINYLLFGCIIPSSSKIGKGTSIAHSVGVVVHHTAIIGQNSKILHNVTIGNTGVIIGDNVLLGAGCVIQGPCKIGDNVKIGANTFVNFDVPDGATVVGSKGRIISKDTPKS